MDYYTKAEAMKRVRPLGKAFCYLGACSLYLDHQVWLPHYHWWHPLTWLLYVTMLFVHGFANWHLIHGEMFLPKKRRTRPYSKAPKGEVRRWDMS